MLLHQISSSRKWSHQLHSNSSEDKKFQHAASWLLTLRQKRSGRRLIICQEYIRGEAFMEYNLLSISILWCWLLSLNVLKVEFFSVLFIGVNYFKKVLFIYKIKVYVPINEYSIREAKKLGRRNIYEALTSTLLHVRKTTVEVKKLNWQGKYKRKAALEETNFIGF